MIPEKDFSTGWDWYGCTLETDPVELVKRLEMATRADVELRTRAGRWDALYSLHRNSEVICTVAESAQRPGEPFFESKSHSPELVPIIREWFPVHRVARVDARIDFVDEDWWDVIEAEMRGYAMQKNMLLEPIGPHLQPHLGGRTWNLGKSESWQRCATLYEKGCELRLPTRGPIRLEVKVRPPSKIKDYYCDLTVREVLMDNAFVRYLADRLFLDFTRASSTRLDRPRSDLDRLMDVFARQYMPTFKLLAERYETMAEFRDELQRRAELDAEIRDYRSKTEVSQSWTVQETVVRDVLCDSAAPSVEA